MNKLLKACIRAGIAADEIFCGNSSGQHGRWDAVTFRSYGEDEGNGYGRSVRNDVVSSKRELSKQRQHLLAWHGEAA